MRGNVRFCRRPLDGMLIQVVPNWQEFDSGRTGFTEEAAFYAHAVPVGVSVDWTVLGDVPIVSVPARDLRNAWAWDGAKVVIDPARADAIYWARVRQDRDARLQESDAMMLRANELSVGGAAWRAYRQALRDLPQTQPDPKRIVWPLPPF